MTKKTTRKRKTDPLLIAIAEYLCERTELEYRALKRALKEAKND